MVYTRYTNGAAVISGALSRLSSAPIAGTTDGGNTVTVIGYGTDGATPPSTANTDYFFLGTLFTNSPTCDTTSTYPTCRPSCSPNITTQAASCISSTYTSTQIAAGASVGPHWVVATTSAPTGASFILTYAPEFRGQYDLTVQQFYTVGNGLRGRYYDNVWFINTPVITRVDPTINYQWGTGAITTYGVDYVSVRWDGKIKPLYSEAYTIYAYADDGVRVWIDRRLLIDSWSTCCNETSRTVTLSATTYHDIIVEYYELRGQATMELRYSSANTPKQIIPQSVLYAPTDIQGSPFTNITMGSGIARPATSYAISSSALTKAQAGQLTNFTIQTRDQYSNNLDTAGNGVFNLSLFAGGDPFPNTTVTYSGSGGIWNAYYSVIKTGTYLMYLSLTGRGVVAGFPTTVIVTPGPTMANTSYATGTGLTTATSGTDATFTIQARDLWNNNRASGNDDIFVNFGGTVGYTLYVSAGSYTAWYTPTTSGSVTLKVFIGGVAITGSPFTVTVAPGAMNHATTIAYGIGLTVATTTIPYTFYIQARDAASNNATTSNSATFSIVLTLTTDATKTTSGTAVSQGNGLYLVTYTVSTAGTYTMVVTGTSPSVGAIVNSPFTVVASPSVAYPLYCTASGITNGVSGTLATFTVQLKDSGKNNLVTSGTAPVAAITCSSVVVTPTCTYSGSGGLYTCTYTPTAIGSPCSLVVTVSSTNIENSPFDVTISPAAASYLTSTLSGTGLTYGVSGTAASFTLKTYDAASNALTAGGNIVSVTMVSGSYSITPTLQDKADGTYLVSYTPTIAANYTTTVSLTVGGGLNAYYYTDMVFGTLTQSQVVSTVSFDWGNGGPSFSGFPSNQFSIKFVGKIKPVYSETYTFYTALGSIDGVRLTIGTTIVINSFDPSNSATEPYGSVTLVAGTFYDILIEYKEDSGTAAISLYWRSASTAKQIVPSTYLYHVDAVTTTPLQTFIKPKLPASSATTSSFVAPSTTLTAGTAITFTIQAKDIYGNNQIYQDEASSFAVYLASSPSYTTGSVAAASSGAGGLYTATITPGVAGTWLLYVTLNTVSIVGSGQLLITVVPGLASATTSIVNGLAATTAGTVTTFTITAKDVMGNVLTSNTATFTVAFTVSSTTIFSATPSYQSGGTYLVSYTPTLINTYEVWVQLSSVHIVNSHTNVVVSAGVAAASTTAVTLPGSTPAATTAGTVTTFTITTKDANGNLNTDTKQTFYVYFDNNQGLTYPATSVASSGGANYLVTYSLPQGPSTGNQYLYNVMVAASGVGNGLTGTYYNNRWLQSPSVLTRIDSKIYFDWGTDLITPTAKDYVSIVWTGYFAPTMTGKWAFTVALPISDGVRLYVDGYLRMNEWTTNTAASYITTDILLTANLLVPIRLEYRANTGTASVSLWYQCTDASCIPTVAIALVPTARLWSSASHITNSPFTVAVT